MGASALLMFSLKKRILMVAARVAGVRLRDLRFYGRPYSALRNATIQPPLPAE